MPPARDIVPSDEVVRLYTVEGKSVRAIVAAMAADGVATTDYRVRKLLIDAEVLSSPSRPGGRGRRGRRPGDRRADPFTDTVPDFFEHLRARRGLREGSVERYRRHLTHFEAYLGQARVSTLRELSPDLLRTFVDERARALARPTLHECRTVLRTFVWYAGRRSLVASNLWKNV